MGQASSQAAGSEHSNAKPIGMLVAAVGVVYGDIGTSPLYTLKEVFSGGYGVQVNNDGIFGILALIFWSLIWVVSIKYVLFILRADNQGEGGIMALTALARRAASPYPKLRSVLVILGLIGAALFYGDSMITPAISVLSAVEGLELAFDGLERWVVPLSLVVLVGLFLIQKHGTDRIGKLFGPVMVLWFLVLGGEWHQPASGSAQRVEPGVGCAFLHGPPWHGCGDFRRRGAGIDRCRSALRRHGPLRAQTYRPCVVRAGAAGAGAQLFRPRCAAARKSRSGA